MMDSEQKAMPDGDYTSYTILCAHCKKPVRALLPEGDGLLAEALEAAEAAEKGDDPPLYLLCPFCGLFLSTIGEAQEKPDAEGNESHAQ